MSVGEGHCTNPACFELKTQTADAIRFEEQQQAERAARAARPAPEDADDGDGDGDDDDGAADALNDTTADARGPSVDPVAPAARNRAVASAPAPVIPREHLVSILDHFRATLPNEAAAFVLWNESTQGFDVHFPVVDDATPSRLVYRTPVLPTGCHLVCDLHSHGAAPAFFSATDDVDDVHATKIATVIGHLDRPGGLVMVSRLCAGGIFLSLPRHPFSGGSDVV